jgi:hypothetical protein
MSNLSATNATLRELRRLGRLEKIDASWVQALRSMARALDDNPSNAALWRQYLAATADLLGADDDADSSLNAALKEIRGAAEMGDTSPA